MRPGQGKSEEECLDVTNDLFSGTVCQSAHKREFSSGSGAM
uniref:Uncharacterized protein n=1 Tax=Anguilla anguilla TaxID=7936 RepID=A0A0E9UBF6_ANGAN